MASYRISKFLVLVLAEGKHQCVQNEAQVGNQLCTGLLFQSRNALMEGKTQELAQHAIRLQTESI